MGGKDDQEGNNDSGSDDDIAFADDDNDTKDEETNVESYDSDDENLEEVSFMLIPKNSLLYISVLYLCSLGEKEELFCPSSS